MSAIHDEINRVFGVDGWLVQRGGYHLPEQLQYALSVADWLTGESSQPIGMIEGDTGTGKTLGYLFPIILHWAQTGKRVVIATHTIALQNQILDGDMERVNEYLIDKNLPLPTVRQRLGMQHFVDPSRVARLAEMLTGENHELNLLSEWAHTTVLHSSGLIEEWIERYGPLPESVTRDAICMTPGSPGFINPMYEAHKRVGVGDIVLTSHMMVLLEARSKQAIFNLPEHSFAVLFDEADQVLQSAETLTNRRVQPREIIRELKTLMGQGSGQLDRQLNQSIRELSNIDKEMYALGEDQRITEMTLENTQAHGLLDSLKTECARINQVIHRSALGRAEHDHGQVHVVRELLGWVEGFNSERNDFGINALAWSPTLKLPSLNYQHGRPGLFISNLWRHLGQRVCLTSATLGAANNESIAPGGHFIALKAGLNIAAQSICIEKQYAPTDFGALAIVLADPQIPHPVEKRASGSVTEQGVSLNPVWLTYTASMIKTACHSGPALVLTTSYSEARALGKKLETLKLNPIIHTPGQDLKTAIVELRDGHGQILITPAAWQGTSIRDHSGNQLIKNLVITRIPFQPPNPTRARLAGVMAERRGVITPAKAAQYENQNVRYQTLIKLRQGIGRLIRSKTDSGTLWIADPRLPHATDARSAHRFFIRAIPSRFYPAYDRAQIFRHTGEMTSARPPIPEALQELINL